MRLTFFRVAAAFSFLLLTNASAQVFGSPEEEQKRLSQMSADVEKIGQTTDYLISLRERRLADFGPAEKRNNSAIEKWQRDNSALTIYVDLFRDMRGAAITLINAVAISLQARDRARPPFHLGLICNYMPGQSELLTALKKQGDGSIPKNWAIIGERTLSPAEMARVRDGLLVLDRLADAYNDLCARASNTANWKN